MKKSLIALLLLAACGKNAPQSEAERYILNHDRPETLNASIELSDEAREIIILAFPEKSEMENYSFDRSKSSIEEEKDFIDLFSLVEYGDKYTFDIPKDMTPTEKLQGLIGKIITIADARDNSRRMSFEPKKIIAKITGEINQKLISDFPCYEVTKRRHANIRKCYLKPVPGVTKDVPKNWGIQTCGGIESAFKQYLNLSPDESIPANSESEYFLSANQIPNWSEEIATCNQNEELVKRYESLAGLGKLEVASLLGSAEISDKLIFTAASQIETGLSGEFTVVFNPKTLVFEKFLVTMDFKDGTKAEYSPENGNMTMPIVTEINGSGFYRVDFEIKTPLFTLKTLGLSLDLDPIFGLRVSGKTRLYYHDGRTRAGIIRIDVPVKE